MALEPTATQITVLEVLGKFDSDFSAVADAVANGEFALWLGSGLSRKAPDLGQLIERALEYLRVRAINPALAQTFMPAFEEALVLAGIQPSTVQGQFATPFASWPEKASIVDALWTRYSDVLDISLAGEAQDYILWNAIDIRDAFSNPAPPAAEHLCIAVLILEGVVQTIASANWDSFVERAVERLSAATPATLQVVVDPSQLREPPGRAQLLKFHGCVAYAAREPATFRRYLTGSRTQILNWPHDPAFAAIVASVRAAATNQKTLVLGLSIQDHNLQGTFAAARAVNPWPFPCAPSAPGHVFCEDTIKQGQKAVLQVVYGASYNAHKADIHRAAHLRSWAEQVLIALAFKIISEKLLRLMENFLVDVGKTGLAGPLRGDVLALRDVVARYAVVDPADESRTPFVNRAIANWSRLLSIFRRGALPSDPLAYEAFTGSALNMIATDANALASGLGRLGVALALLHHGHAQGNWSLQPPADGDVSAGSMGVLANRPGATGRSVFLVKSATEAIKLSKAGALDGQPIVIHGDSAWATLSSAGGSARRLSSAPGRTGRVTPTHISIELLLAASNDAASLQKQFVAEMPV